MDYKPSASLDNIKHRANVLAKIRTFFAKQNVLEVDTPILSQAGATDVYLQSVTASFECEGSSKQGYLHTSPEFAMKRLLADWQIPIYQITKVFRDGEMGHKHNIEFTMLEWYRPNASLDDLIKELNGLINCVFEVDTIFERLSYRQAFLDHAYIDPFTASLDDLEQVASHFNIETSLFRQVDSVNFMANKTRYTQTGLDVNALLSRLDESPKTSINEALTEASINEAAKEAVKETTNDASSDNPNPYGFMVSGEGTEQNVSSDVISSNKDGQQDSENSSADETDHAINSVTNKNNNETTNVAEETQETETLSTSELKEAWLDLLYSHVVEPNLGQSVPTVIYDFPASQASLAKVAEDEHGNLVAKRFELYIKGLEIANAYDELADGEEQHIRFELDNEARAEKGLPVITIDKHLINALDDMPNSVGIALGLDRLVMLTCEADTIEEVICFTTNHA